jgi:hypothetical protein
MFARLGAQDIRKTSQGTIDFRLQRQLRAYAKLDAPPHRVKPIPVQVVRHALACAYSAGGTEATKAISDMIAIAFFFLLRPGEYTGDRKDSDPFRLEDIQVFVGRTRYSGAHLLTLSPTVLGAATGISLTFTTQKNSVQGEVIHHGCSGSLTLCPVKAVLRRILHLREHTHDLKTPLASYFQANKLRAVAAKDVTSALRLSVATIGPSLGFLPEDISARSLRAGGAMALLCANIDKNVISLLGRWRSDEMMRYLHVQAQPVMKHFAQKMLVSGEFHLVPGQTVPSQ